MPVKHAFVSTQDQGSDPDKVSKDEWDADHTGVLWTPDEPPSSPSAYDDEFSALSGWTTLGTLDVLNITDITSRVHLKRVQSAWNVDGIYKASPPFPFTVTAKITDCLLNANYQTYGIMFAESSPGKLWVTGPVYQSSYAIPEFLQYPWTTRTSRGSGTEYHPGWPLPFGFVRVVATSTSSVVVQWSYSGLVWINAFSGINPGFTVGNVGLFMTANDNAQTCEMYVDWIRFVLGSVGQTWNGTAWV